RPSAAPLRVRRDGAPTVWRARPGVRDGLRLWPRVCRADGCRPVPIAGFGRRILLGRRSWHLVLDRSRRTARRRSDDDGARAAALLPPFITAAGPWRVGRAGPGLGGFF